jgi:hypothetical protein
MASCWYSGREGSVRHERDRKLGMPMAYSDNSVVLNVVVGRVRILIQGPATMTHHILPNCSQPVQLEKRL